MTELYNLARNFEKFTEKYEELVATSTCYFLQEKLNFTNLKNRDTTIFPPYLSLKFTSPTKQKHLWLYAVTQES